jgi:hypothetical protein
VFGVLSKDAFTLSALAGQPELAWMACCLRFLIETVQGPAPANQELLASSGSLVRNLCR